MALYNFIQAQLQNVNSDITGLRTSLQSVAAHDEMQQRFTVTDQGINALSQKIDAAIQAVELKVSALSTVVATIDPRGAPRQNGITEPMPVNKLKH